MRDCVVRRRILAVVACAALTSCKRSRLPQPLGPGSSAQGCSEGTEDDDGFCVPVNDAACPDELTEVGEQCVLAEGTVGELVLINGGLLHEHHISTFLADRTEVTVAAYRLCVEAGVCEEPSARKRLSFLSERKEPRSEYNYAMPDRESHPMNGVTAAEAEGFCKWAGKRLPTEWEWEWAARGREQGRTYPWGDEAPRHDLVNACGPACERRVSQRFRWHSMYGERDGHEETAPVGSHPSGVSRDGLLDMAGNVQEWTSTREPLDGGNEAGVLRGGSWFDYDPELLQTSHRRAYWSGGRSSEIGFRCVRSF